MPLMMLLRRHVLTVAVLAPLALAACEQEGPAEQAGEAIDETVEEAGEAID